MQISVWRKRVKCRIWCEDDDNDAEVFVWNEKVSVQIF